jgi:hypothetical protein
MKETLKILGNDVLHEHAKYVNWNQRFQSLDLLIYYIACMRKNEGST